MKIKTDSNQARKAFRILSLLVVLIGIHGIYSSIRMLINGYNSVTNLILAFWFTIEFGSIALRGRGLLVRVSTGNKKNEEKTTEPTA